jgi:drug/metabolite transporter (DMT)-like permease
LTGGTLVGVSRDGVVRCLLAAVLFGAAAPAASRLAGSMPAFTLAGLLYVGAALAVLPSVLSQPPSRRAVAREWRPALTAVVVGGALGPVLLMAGLARTSAATGSLLLNTELAATAVIAAVFFREHLGRRLLVSVALITLAGVLLTWQPGASIDAGALLIIAACVSWGLDNCVTAGIEHLTPAHVVALKGAVAGSANLVIGLTIAGWGAGTSIRDVIAALIIGVGGYGISTVLWVQGARQLGAARGQVIFATAPFIGAAIAWIGLGESVTALQVLAAAVAVAGVAISLRSAHEHEHTHASLVHDHEHAHDDGHHDAGHGHGHGDGAVTAGGRHRHVHRHRERTHAHPHVPDLHHRHEH